MKKVEEEKTGESDRMSEADSLFKQAFDTHKRGEYQATLQLYSKCCKLFEQEGRMDGVIKALTCSSVCQNRLANYEEAF